MLSISPTWRKSRKTDKAGTVQLSIREGKKSYSIALGIECAKDEMLSIYRSRIAWYMKFFYIYYSRQKVSHPQLCLEKIVDDFRRFVQENRFDKELSEVVDTGFDYDRDNVSFASRYIEKKVRPIPTDDFDSEPTLGNYILRLINTFNSTGKIFTARNFRSTHNSLKVFLNNQKLLLTQINSQFITNYEKYLVSTGISPDTISFYLRTLRIILNHATQDCFIGSCADWFSQVNTTAFQQTEADKNKVLDKGLLKRISEIDLSNSQRLELSRDIFMFSFYMKGLELTDIANLKRDNILSDGYLVYRRRKIGNIQRVRINQKAHEIIEKYIGDDSVYIFPLNVDGKNRVFANVRGNIARHLKQIGNKIGCPDLTLKMTRATWQALSEQTNITDHLLE